MADKVTMKELYKLIDATAKQHPINEFVLTLEKTRKSLITLHGHHKISARGFCGSPIDRVLLTCTLGRYRLKDKKGQTLPGAESSLSESFLRYKRWVKQAMTASSHVSEACKLSVRRLKKG